jgi:hypothetical protein
MNGCVLPAPENGRHQNLPDRVVQSK